MARHPIPRPRQRPQPKPEAPSLILTHAERVLLILAKHGYLKNEPWVQDNITKAELLFSPQNHRHLAVAALAPNAIDYLVQCPILPLLIEPNPNPDITNSITASLLSMSKLALRLQGNPKLRDVMRELGCPKPLRALRVPPASTEHWKVIKQLCTVNPSTLSQSIPASPKEHGFWVHNLMWWLPLGNPPPHQPSNFEWAVKRVAYVGPTANVTAADFARHHPINERWSFERVLKEAEQWHIELQSAGQEKAFFLRHGLEWDQPVPNHPIEIVTVDNYIFKPLNTGKALWQEGKEMHHCVASYSEELVSGRSFFYSVQHETLSSLRYTAELKVRRPWVPGIGQISGLCNRQPSLDVCNAIAKFCSWLSGYHTSTVGIE